MVNPDQSGSRVTQGDEYNRRTRGQDSGPGGNTRARIHRMRGGAGVDAPPAGG